MNDAVARASPVLLGCVRRGPAPLRWTAHPLSSSHWRYARSLHVAGAEYQPLQVREESREWPTRRTNSRLRLITSCPSTSAEMFLSDGKETLQGSKVHLESMFVRATNLRYIHLPASLDPVAVLNAARKCARNILCSPLRLYWANNSPHLRAAASEPGNERCH